MFSVQVRTSHGPTKDRQCDPTRTAALMAAKVSELVDRDPLAIESDQTPPVPIAVLGKALAWLAQGG